MNESSASLNNFSFWEMHIVLLGLQPIIPCWFYPELGFRFVWTTYHLICTSTLTCYISLSSGLWNNHSAKEDRRVFCSVIAEVGSAMYLCWCMEACIHLQRTFQPAYIITSSSNFKCICLFAWYIFYCEFRAFSEKQTMKMHWQFVCEAGFEWEE